MRVPSLLRPRSLAGQLFAVQAVLIAVVVAGCALFTYISDRSQAEDAAGRQALAVAAAVADAPSVRDAIHTDKPTERLQPYATEVQRHSGVDFVTIMTPDGIRWTHPVPERIGRRFVGHIERAQQGGTITETYTGTLGPSVRAVTPIKEDGRVIGLVSAGIKVQAISDRVQGQVTALLGVAAGALALGGVGTYIVNARLRRHTHNMNAAELSNMHDYHQAALHAVREGLLMLDGQYRVALLNDGARELLGVTEDVIGRSVAELGLPAPLTGALLSSEPRVDEVLLTAERVLVVNTSPVSGGQRRGTVVTLRDVTELQSVMGELNSERGFTQALRSQAHEAANRLHTVVSLIELGRSDEAIDFATAELELAQALTDQVVAAVTEPVLAALLLGKAAQANERGVELVVSEDSRIDDGLLPESLPARDLVTVLGNLIDNAVDAAQGTTGARVTVTAYTDGPAGRPDDPGGPGEPGSVGGPTRGDNPGSAGGPTDAGNPGSVGGPGTPGDPRRRAKLESPGGPGGSQDGPGGSQDGPDGPQDGPDRSKGHGPDRSKGQHGPYGSQAQGGPADPAQGPVLVLRVRDTGAGVDPAYRDSVFERGFSTKPSGPGGRGLGLALVRQTARRHGGTLSVSEAPGGGAEFEVRLPLAEAEGARAGATDPADAVPTPRVPRAAVADAVPGGDDA